MQRNGKENKQQVWITARIPKRIKDSLAKIVANNDLSISHAIRKALSDYVAKHTSSEKP